MLNFFKNKFIKCKYISDHSTTFLTKKNNSEWTLKHQKQFDENKTLLTEKNVKTIPDSNQPFYAMCELPILELAQDFFKTYQGTKKSTPMLASS